MRSVTCLAVTMKPLLSCCIVLSLVGTSLSTQGSGILRHNEDNGAFVRLLARFGAAKGQSLYVYGTSERIVDSVITFHSQMILVFMPQDVWDRFYPLSRKSSPLKCENVVSRAFNESISVSDERCLSGERDLIRKIPCDSSEPTACNQPTNTTGLINSSDFTYRVDSNPRTQFYYLAVVACTRNSSASPEASCRWASSADVKFDYNFHIVNSDPDVSVHFNPFDYEFPYNFKGVLLSQVIFTALYVVLIVVHCMIHSNLCNPKDYRMHTLPKLFTVALFFEVFHVTFEMIHSAVYAHNGQGVIAIRYLGAVWNQFSDWFLISVLLLVAKGWQVTTASLRWKKITVAIWSIYILASAVYFCWMVIQEQVYPLSSYTSHPFQSWAGGLYLAYRLILLLYILYEMRQNYLIENRPFKLKLYICFAVCFILWFCSLPLTVFIAAFINPVERFKLISISIFVYDFLLNCGVLLLFCPKWSNRYFQFESHINQLHQFSKGFKSLKTYGGAESNSRLV